MLPASRLSRDWCLCRMRETRMGFFVDWSAEP